jgi:hypothetical protein
MIQGKNLKNVNKCQGITPILLFFKIIIFIEVEA